MTANSSFSHKIPRRDFDSHRRTPKIFAAALCRDALNPAAVKGSNRFERIRKLIFQSLTHLKPACNPSAQMGNSGPPLEGAAPARRRTRSLRETARTVRFGGPVEVRIHNRRQGRRIRNGSGVACLGALILCFGRSDVGGLYRLHGFRGSAFRGAPA